MAKVYNFVGKFGSAGSGNGQFNGIEAVAVDANYIYVTDSNNHRVQIFNKTTYAYVGQFGSSGTGDGQFNKPFGIAVDASYIYVVDEQNFRVQIFNKTTYAYVNKFSTPAGGGSEVPRGITLDDAANYIYVSAYFGGNGIGYYDKGSYAQIGTMTAGGKGLLANNISNVYRASIYVGGLKIYSKATGLQVGVIADGTTFYGVAVDNNYIYTVSSSDYKVEVYDINTLAFVEFFGSLGSGDGQFTTARAIAVYNDVFYVVDQGNNRIQVFDFTYQTAPAAPSGLTAACGVNRTIELNWTDNS